MPGRPISFAVNSLSGGKRQELRGGQSWRKPNSSCHAFLHFRRHLVQASQNTNLKATRKACFCRTDLVVGSESWPICFTPIKTLLGGMMNCPFPSHSPLHTWYMLQIKTNKNQPTFTIQLVLMPRSIRCNCLYFSLYIAVILNIQAASLLG